MANTRSSGGTGVQATAKDPKWIAGPKRPNETYDEWDDRRLNLNAQYLTEWLKANPGNEVPPGYKMVQTQNGPQVVPTQPSFLMRHPWLIPLMGAAAGILGGAAAGTGLLGGGATGAADAVIPGVVGGTAPGAAAGAAPVVAGASDAAVAAGATGAAAAGGTAAAAGETAAVGGTAAAGGTAATAGTLTSIPDFVGPTQQAATGTNSILSNAQRAENIGRVLNGVNTGQQQGRESEAQATTRWDANANTRYKNSIDAAALNLKAPGERGATSVQGDILANAKPFQWTGETKMVGNTPVPQYTGGLTPSLFSDNTKALGSLMSQQALQQQQTNGGQAVGPQDPLTPLPQAGPGSKILQGAGIAASIYGAYAGRR